MNLIVSAGNVIEQDFQFGNLRCEETTIFQVYNVKMVGFGRIYFNCDIH